MVLMMVSLLNLNNYSFPSNVYQLGEMVNTTELTSPLVRCHTANNSNNRK